MIPCFSPPNTIYCIVTLRSNMTSEPSSPSSAAFVPKRLVYRTRTAAPWRQVIKVCTLGVCCVTLGYTVSTLYTTGDPSCALMPVPQDVSYTMLTAGVGRAGDSADPGEYRRSHQGTLVGDHPHYSVPHRERPGDPPKHSLYDKVSNTVSIFNPWTKDKQPSADAKNATVDKESLYRGLSSAEENREDVAQAHHTNPERPRIGKVTILTGEDNQIYERAIRTHELHNRLHGYSLHTLRESLLNDVWSKPAYILSVLLREMAKPKAERLEWLFWVDADTIILNPYIPAEIFLPPAGWDDTHLMVCHDYNGLNNGIFLIRVHSWSVELLSVIVSYPYWKPGAKLTFRDQSAMADVLTTPKFAKHTVKAPQRWFNAYQGEVNETIAPFQVRRGDLLVHFAGVPDRAQRMELWLQRVEEHNPEWEVELKYTSYPTEVKDYWWEMGQLRDTRRKELAGARKVAENLRDQVQEQLREYQDRMEENPKKRIEHELEHMETILDDKYMGEDVEQLNRTVKILKEVLESPLSTGKKILTPFRFRSRSRSL